MKRQHLLSLLTDDVGFLDDILDKEELLELTPAITMNKPIISPAMEGELLDAISQYLNREKWTKWGMDHLRQQGSAILLEGEPGTGKTTIARWLALKVKKGFLQLTVGDLGGGEPGTAERNIVKFYDEARRKKNATVFMDECDSVLMDRSRIGSEGRTWQLGMCEALMLQMNIYPGLQILATNHSKVLDPALASRLIAVIHIPQPDMELRRRLWQAKLPRAFPFHPDGSELSSLAKSELNGRSIENVICSVAAHAIRKGVRPALRMFHSFIERELAKKLA